jgi:Phage integrase, N-terminal SAM-like domain
LPIFADTKETLLFCGESLPEACQISARSCAFSSFGPISPVSLHSHVFNFVAVLAGCSEFDSGQFGFPARLAVYGLSEGLGFLRGKVWVLRYREDVVVADGTLGRIQRSIVLGPFVRKKEALREAEKHLRPFNTGDFRPQAAITLDDFWHSYFMPEILPTLKHSTRKLYSSLAGKHLLPYFGPLKLSEIQRVQIQHS